MSAIGATTITIDPRYVRILKSTFRRDGDTVVCELGLTRDDSAYELRLDPPRIQQVAPESFSATRWPRFSATR